MDAMTLPLRWVSTQDKSVAPNPCFGSMLFRWSTGLFAFHKIMSQLSYNNCDILSQMSLYNCLNKYRISEIREMKCYNDNDNEDVWPVYQKNIPVFEVGAVAFIVIFIYSLAAWSFLKYF